MTLPLHAVRNAIPSTAIETLSMEAQFLRQTSNCGRNRLNLFDPSPTLWSRDLARNRIVAQPPPRVLKHVDCSSPYIEHTNLTCGNRLVTRAAIYGHPCLTTYYSSALFNSKEKNWKDKHRRSRKHSPSIVRCETEWKGQSDMPSEQTPGHEGHEHCGERKCKRDHPHSEHEQGVRECRKGLRDALHNSDHIPDQRECRHEHCDQIREWGGIRDAYSECAQRREAGHDQHHEGSDWKGRRDLHPEYTPRHREREDELDRVSSSLRVAEKGYIIKVSKELMGLFCYIEKRKRSMIKELAHTLRQVAAVALVLTCVRGILAPLVEVFKTTPPTWSKLLLMLVSLDSVAICYLAIKSSEPLEQLANLATENRPDIMEGVEKEEEMILKIATEFIRLFKRLRNIAISITVSQTAQLMFTVLRLKDPDFVANCSRVVQTWMLAPWT